MPESERKSRWKLAVWCIVFLPVLYWMSAPVTLLICEVCHPNERVPELWYTVYEPVMWAAKHPTLHPVTMKPFEWLNVDGVFVGVIVERWLEEINGRPNY